MIKDKRPIVERLKVGDLIVLGSSHRIVRGIWYENKNCCRSNPCCCCLNKCIKYKRYYFSKLKRSGYPCPWVSYKYLEVVNLFNGLVKRGVDLYMTEYSTLVQQAIDTRIAFLETERCKRPKLRREDEADMAFITEEESVGTVI